MTSIGLWHLISNIQLRLDGLSAGQTSLFQIHRIITAAVISSGFLVDVLLVVAFLLGAFVVYKMVNHRTSVQRNRMKRLINDATEEVRRQKEELINQSEELHKAYEEIQTKNAAIEEAFQHLSDSFSKQRELNKFKEMTTAMIVHDFKNALNTVISFSQGEPTPREVKSINQSGKRLLNMVLNMLDVQKFESTEVALSLSEQFIDEMIRSVIEQMDFLIEQNNITIHYASVKKFLCHVDHELCTRVITNILINALKYSPVNGRIDIRAKKVEGFVEVSFTDQGPGIPEKMLSKIFDKYTQVAPKSSGGIKSTGLGLAFCKMVVQAHGGKIWAESTEGQGATFYMQFPLVKGHKSDAADQDIQIASHKRALDLSNLQSMRVYMKYLKEWEVFDYSDIVVILDQIKEENDDIVYWKNCVINAIQNVNDQEYERLISLFDNEA